MNSWEEGVRHEAKCFVLAVGVMLTVASAAGQQFRLMDTADMPTTGASLALKGMQPTKDAFTVARLRQNGAANSRR